MSKIQSAEGKAYHPLPYDEVYSRKAREFARHYQTGRAIPSEVSSYLSSEVMEGKPSRRQAYDRLLDELAQVCPWTIDSVIMSLIDAFACWVVDLPASEKFHHHGPFGLLDHGLEVSLGAVLTHKRDFEWWRKDTGYSSFGFTLRLVAYLGLLHDFGKVFDVEVKAPRSGEIWDPLREPLAFFKLRHGMKLLDPVPRTHQPGRGVHGHEEKGRALVPAVLHRSLKTPVLPHLVRLYDFYTTRYDRPELRSGSTDDRILHCVLEADRDSARSSAKESVGGADFLDVLSRRKILPPPGAFMDETPA